MALLCDPVREVSAHYVVMPDGTLLQLVAESRRAWHAGRGVWCGETDMNDVSIGIEIAHQGHKEGAAAYPYPEAQIAAVIALSRDIVDRWGIAPHRVLAHSDTAPERKIDPGEFFPWGELARAAIGHDVGPSPIIDGACLEPGAFGPEVEALQALLSEYGYGVEMNAHYDARTEAVVRAFQRHFRPARVDGWADISTIATLRNLLDTRPAG